MSSNIKVKVFPTLLQFTNNFLNTIECKKIIKSISKNKLSEHLCLNGDAKSTHAINSNILTKPIKEKLQIKIDEYQIDYGVRKLKIDNSWVNIQNKNSVLKKHSHPDSIISGVIYLKADEKSSKIYFHNLNPYRTFVDFKKETEFNSENYFFKPQTGDLILFPSWLMHSSDKNNSSSRIALSFNTIYK
tara:strand:+ start:148 stop:711 length:564 start_codon:yes stop_codon:yes gene_type:complete